jgi:arsenate reductase
MAEGLLRQIASNSLEVVSAGSAPSQVNSLAIRVMAERGIDISQHRSKHLEEFAGQLFDVVITVCDLAAETCPVFPGSVERIHWSFPDPAQAKGGEEERLVAFRRVRDGLSERLSTWWQEHQMKDRHV